MHGPPLARPRPACRAGTLAPLFAVMMPVVVILFAFSVDLSYVALTKTQAQGAADAAALAAAMDLYPDARPQTAVKLPLALPVYKPVRPKQEFAAAAASARRVTAANPVGMPRGMTIQDADLRIGLRDQGIVVGPPATVAAVDGLLAALDLRATDHGFANLVRVTVRRSDDVNGRLPLFFAPAFGGGGVEVVASAAAAFSKGYVAAAGDRVLPLAMDITVWNAIRFTNGEANALNLSPLGVDVGTLSVTQVIDPKGPLGALSGMLGQVTLDLTGNPVRVFDDRSWDHRRAKLSAGRDGIWEVLLLADLVEPEKKLPIVGTIVPARRLPALFATLDFRDGLVSAPDAAYLKSAVSGGLPHGSELKVPFDAKGFFEIPTAVEPQLKRAIGKTFMLPLYATIPGTAAKAADMLGRSHTFRIVGWAGVTLTDVNLTGAVRYLKVQPAAYVSGTVRPATGGDRWRCEQAVSDGVYTRPVLVE